MVPPGAGNLCARPFSCVSSIYQLLAVDRARLSALPWSGLAWSLPRAPACAAGGSAVWADPGEVGSSGCSMLRVPWRLAVGVFVLFMACPEAKRGCLLVAASCKAGAKSLQIKMPLKVQYFTHPFIFFFPTQKDLNPPFSRIELFLQPLVLAIPPRRVTGCRANGECPAWSESLPGDASCLPTALLFLLAVDPSPAGWCLCVGPAL